MRARIAVDAHSVLSSRPVHDSETRTWTPAAEGDATRTPGPGRRLHIPPGLGDAASESRQKQGDAARHLKHAHRPHAHSSPPPRQTATTRAPVLGTEASAPTAPGTPLEPTDTRWLQGSLQAGEVAARPPRATVRDPAGAEKTTPKPDATGDTTPTAASRFAFLALAPNSPLESGVARNPGSHSPALHSQPARLAPAPRRAASRRGGAPAGPDHCPGHEFGRRGDNRQLAHTAAPATAPRGTTSGRTPPGQPRTLCPHRWTHEPQHRDTSFPGLTGGTSLGAHTAGTGATLVGWQPTPLGRW